MKQKKTLTTALVIPTYNEADAIDACLQAALAQEHPFDEIIVVDNNSTDSTVELVKKYPVTLITEKKQGVFFARNTGFNVATSDIIGRIDADSLLEPDWTTELLRVFADDSITAVTGPVFYHDMPARATGQRVDTMIRASLDKLSTKAKFLFGSNMALRREAWSVMRDVVCDNTAYHEDLDLAIHLADYEYQILLDKNLIVGVSSRRVEGTVADFRKYMKMYSATYKGHDIREATVTVPILVYWALYPSMKLLRGAYNPETGRISLEKLFLGSSNPRKHPNE